MVNEIQAEMFFRSKKGRRILYLSLTTPFFLYCWDGGGCMPHVIYLKLVNSPSSSNPELLISQSPLTTYMRHGE